MSRSRQVAVLLTVLTAAIAGCTNHPTSAPAPTAGSAEASTPAPNPSTATGGTPQIRLTPPQVVAGELSRSVLSRKDDHPNTRTTLHRSAQDGLEYGVQAACTSTTPGKTLSVEVRSGEPGASEDAMSTATIPCDATISVDGFGNLPATPILVDLRGDQSDVLSAYAILAPVSSLRADG